MKSQRILCVIVTALCFFAVIALATVPNTINYQGTLTDSSGISITGTHSMTFTLYSDSTGGTSLWTEIQSAVEVTDGLFRVLLGSVTSFPATLFDGSTLWLGILVSPDLSELSPRQPIVSVAYSMKTANADYATDADQLDGQDGSYYRNASNLDAGTVSEARLPQNTIDGSEIQDNSLTASDLASNSVGFSELQDPMIISSGYWDVEKTSFGVALSFYNNLSIPTYCDVAWFLAPYQYATDHWNVYSSTKGGRAFYGSKTLDDNAYCGYFRGASSTSEGVYVYGTVVYTGTDCAVEETPSGRVALFGTNSTEVEFTTNGTAQLNNGSVNIVFDRLFSETISPNVPVRVITTPIGASSVLYVDDVTKVGCTVKSDLGDPNVEFNWIAIGRRKGYDQRPDITIPDPVEEERIRQMKEAAMAKNTR